MNRDLQGRKCSHCGYNGHNSRTCHGKGIFKLFGVQINLGGDEREYQVESSSMAVIRKRRNYEEDECMRKSKSMDNLVQACNFEHDHAAAAGYLSDGVIHTKSDRVSALHERKKGVPWTEDEHRSFLSGLKKLGKGDWKGISKNYVPTKTPTQVASHAQKYFIRMTSTEKKKRRHSLFDIPFKESTPDSPFDKAAEVSQQVSTTLVDPLKNINEIQGQTSTSVHVAASEKPPLSPMARAHVPNICHMPYMVGVPGQRFTAATVMRRELFPMMTYPNPGYLYLPSSNENFVSCAPFMNQKSSCLYFGPFPRGPSQAGPTTKAARSFATCAPFLNQTSRSPVTSDGKKDGLEASIGALSL